MPRSRVLVVDDSRLQRRILIALLDRNRLDVMEAASGEEALAICRSRPVDIVISDWMMPGMSGLDLCRALRGGEDGLGGELGASDGTYIYFILLTSKGEKGDIAEGLSVGADDFLTKPVDRAELSARIQAGERIITMQSELRETSRARGDALEKVSALNAAIERDLEQSRRLQHSLVRCWRRDYGAVEVTLALRSSGHVGGDLVGFFPASREHVAVYGIDVSGHGITSALMSARLKGFLSSGRYAQNVAVMSIDEDTRFGRPPHVVARRLNDLTLEEMETENYFTMVYADLDTRTGRVVFTQAGHPPPLVLRADGETEFVGEGGLPIGLIGEAMWDEHEVQLRPGDRMLIYSDGVTECEDPAGTMLEEVGLARMARTHQALAGKAFLDAMLADLRRHAALCVGGCEMGQDNCDFTDDVSIALLEYRGGPMIEG